MPYNDRSCQHHLYPIDTELGVETCTGCGLVLGPVYSYGVSDSSPIECKQPTIIQQIADRYNIPSAIEKEASQVYKRISLHLRKRHSLVAMAYALHQACVSCEAPRSLNEICSMFDIPVKDLSSFQSKCHRLEPQVNLMQPSDFLPRLVFPRPIPYQTMSDWATFADNLYKRVASTPVSVLAFVMYKYLKLQKQNSRIKPCIDGTMSNIAKICNVSPTSIKRLNRSTKRLNIDTKLRTLIVHGSHSLSRQKK